MPCRCSTTPEAILSERSARCRERGHNSDPKPIFGQNARYANNAIWHYYNTLRPLTSGGDQVPSAIPHNILNITPSTHINQKRSIILFCKKSDIIMIDITLNASEVTYIKDNIFKLFYSCINVV